MGTTFDPPLLVRVKLPVLRATAVGRYETVKLYRDPPGIDVDPEKGVVKWESEI
jgi:hypothetical protein